MLFSYVYSQRVKIIGLRTPSILELTIIQQQVKEHYQGSYPVRWYGGLNDKFNISGGILSQMRSSIQEEPSKIIGFIFL